MDVYCSVERKKGQAIERKPRTKCEAKLKTGMLAPFFD